MESRKIEWFSPIGSSNFREFSDKTFKAGRFHENETSFWEGLERPNFDGFWPNGGPHWDGIAVITKSDNRKCLLLVEAKAHKSELYSDIGAKDESSLSQIKNTLNCYRDRAGLKETDWTKRYYQCANRLAFLFYLQEHHIDASLLFLLFANDPYWNSRDKMNVLHWENSIKKEYMYFGIEDSFLRERAIFDCIIDLEESSWSELKEKIGGRIAEAD